MKKRIFMFIILLLVPFISIICVDKWTPKYKFAIYLVKDLSTFEASKTDINKLPLESKPVITEDNISAFYWKDNVIKTDSSLVYDKLIKTTPMFGAPFVLIANGERIYVGAFWSSFSSVSPPNNITVVDIGGYNAMDLLSTDGYNISSSANDHYFEISAPFNGKDIRIYNALKKTLILKK